MNPAAPVTSCRMFQCLRVPNKRATRASRDTARARVLIDPLSRTAARTYGPRVVGVLLSGRNADGTAGLLNVVLHGGRALVQDPAEAEHKAMPLSALANVPGARCLRVADIASVLVRAAVDATIDHQRGAPLVGRWAVPLRVGAPASPRPATWASPSCSASQALGHRRRGNAAEG